SASKWTVQPFGSELGSSAAFDDLIASGPGLIKPVIFLPSQSNTSDTSLRCVAVGPQSPCHVPTSGCPSCARIGAMIIRSPTTHASRKGYFRMHLLTDIRMSGAQRLLLVADRDFGSW